MSFTSETTAFKASPFPRIYDEEATKTKHEVKRVTSTVTVSDINPATEHPTTPQPRSSAVLRTVSLLATSSPLAGAASCRHHAAVRASRARGGARCRRGRLRLGRRRARRRLSRRGHAARAAGVGLNLRLARVLRLQPGRPRRGQRALDGPGVQRRRGGAPAGQPALPVGHRRELLGLAQRLRGPGLDGALQEAGRLDDRQVRADAQGGQRERRACAQHAHRHAIEPARIPRRRRGGRRERCCGRTW